MSIVELDALPDMVAEATEAGLPVVFRCDTEPPAHVRKLMAVLGVTVEVRTVTPPAFVSAHDATITRDCAFYGCTDDARPGGRFCSAHDEPTLSRAEKVERIRQHELETPDLTWAQRAEQLGMTGSAYRNLKYDPDGSKQAARRQSYEGTCVSCGAPTKSNGTATPSTRCRSCARSEAKVWTRDAVIAAIQEWAAEHGAPPTAADWHHADRENGRWPAATSIYNPPSGAFGSWADAIEAAGFARPAAGHYDRSAVRLPRRAFTHDSAIEVVLAWRDEHGRMPKTTDWRRGTTLPSQDAVKRLFGGWPAMIAAAEHQLSGRAAASPAPAPVETPAVSPALGAGAARPHEPVRPGTPEPLSPGGRDEETARPDTSHSSPSDEDAKQEVALLERAVRASVPDRIEFSLALSGDFARDADRVRHEAEKLRRQAQALDTIAAGIDQLAGA